MLRQIFCKGELGKRIYVSFSHFVNGRNVEKSRQCIQAVPEDRILVESDLHDVAAAGEALASVIELVSQARGWSADEARERLACNSRLFFSQSDKRGTQIGGADGHASVVMPTASQRSSTYSADDGRGTVSSGRSSGTSGSYGRVEKISRLEKLKSLPESLEEAVCNLPFQLDEIACTPMFREQMEEEACTVLDLSRLLERSPLPLFLRIHETKAATTHVLLLTAPTGARRLDRVTRSALKLGWPRVTSIKIFTSIGSVDEELDYKIWMPRDYTRYFPNLRSIAYVAYDVGSGYFREMCHTMGRQQTKAVVFRASQRHMDVLNLSARLMRYMAHANFLMTSLGLTISAEPRYPDYVFTVIRT
ncbi:Cut9-interacting protein scn1, partial [Coemansia sp. RSA 2703]